MINIAMQERSKLSFLISISVCIAVMGASYAGNGKEQPAHLSVQISDESTGELTEARVRITHADGQIANIPEVGIGVMYGRDGRVDGYSFQPDGAFYVDGGFEMDMQPGSYKLVISKGFEFLASEYDFDLSPGDRITKNIALKRWIDMPARGWYSADDHIHIQRSPRENPYILKWIAAEDVHVGALLRMGDFWTTYFEQYAFGDEGVYEDKGRVLTPGQEEPRTHEIGHTISLMADEAVRMDEEYYYYDRLFDRVHELNGLSGYAHQGMSFHGYRGMTMDVLVGKIDFLELLQFCVEEGPMHTDHFYFFLDLGFKLTATGGSDFPWCGVWPNPETGVSERITQIGNARFYTYVGDSFSFDKWKDSFKAGHTFVSSGPMIDLKVNGALPGDVVKVKKGQTLRISAKAFGHPDKAPLRGLEIMGHGQVLKSVSAEEANQSGAERIIDLELPADVGIWIAARCTAAKCQTAHTTPVYVSVDGGGFHNPATTQENLDQAEKYLREIEEEIAERADRARYQAWRYKEGLEERIAETRKIIAELRTKLK